MRHKAPLMEFLLLDLELALFWGGALLAAFLIGALFGGALALGLKGLLFGN